MSIFMEYILSKKPIDNLIDLIPMKVLEEDIKHYYVQAKIEEIVELKILKNAVVRAKDNISEVKDAKIDAQIKELQNAASMSFVQLTFDLALGVLGGGAISMVAKYSLGKILKSRLQIGTIKLKLRIADGTSVKSASKTVRTLKQRYKNKPYKYNKKKNHYNIKMIKEINLDPNSWESLFLEKVPELLGGRVDELIQGRDNIKSLNKSETKTITLSDFFNDQISMLDDQIAATKKNYADVNRDLVKSMISPSKDHIRNIIKSIREAEEFGKINKLDKITLDTAVRENIFSQPILIGGCFQAGFIPNKIRKILPSRESRYDYLLATGPSGKPLGRSYKAALPERVKANKVQKNVLMALSKAFLVPSLLNKNKTEVISFFDYYDGRNFPNRPQVALVKYFNEIHIDRILVALRRIGLEVVTYTMQKGGK